LLVAIPVATVVGATALVYAALNTFSSGQTLSSSLMNANFSNLDARLKALEAASGVSVSNDGGTTGLPVFVPPGTIVAYGGSITAGDAGTSPPPAGWLLCDGSAVSRTTYAALFTAVGIAHGGGDGATTFNLPNYRGRFLRGVDLGAGIDPDTATRTAPQPGNAANGVGNTGDAVGSLQGYQLQSHNHGIGGAFLECGGGPYQAAAGTGAFGNVACNGIGVAATGGNETRPVNAYVNYVIKF